METLRHRKAKPKTRQRRKTARPGELLTAGFEEFAEKGFFGTRLEDVAARAGVVKGTIYLYFDSKEALFEAAVRDRISPILDEIFSVVEGFEGPTTDLMRLVLKVVYGRLADPQARTLFRIMIAEGHRFPHLLEFYHDAILSKLIVLMGCVLERGIARGEFQKSAATDLPLVIMAPAIAGIIWQMTFAVLHPIELEKFHAAHVDLLMMGLRCGNDRRP